MKNKRIFKKGFSLIELMIVVAVGGILIAIALPSYTEQVRKGNRAIARAHLLDIANRQQEFFLNNKTYATNLAALGFTAASIGFNKTGEEVAAGAADAVYQFNVVSGTATTFSLTAVPHNSQAGDTDCGTFGLISDGTKSATGGLGMDCWD